MAGKKSDPTLIELLVSTEVDGTVADRGAVFEVGGVGLFGVSEKEAQQLVAAQKAAPVGHSVAMELGREVASEKAQQYHKYGTSFAR